jgi:hypothetical protein
LNAKVKEPGLVKSIPVFFVRQCLIEVIEFGEDLNGLLGITCGQLLVDIKNVEKFASLIEIPCCPQAIWKTCEPDSFFGSRTERWVVPRAGGWEKTGR